MVTNGGSRCPAHERKRELERLALEPWQAFYDEVAWQKVRAFVKRRDDYRCRWESDGRRCANTGVTGFVSVHHVKKLSVLWLECGRPKRGEPGWANFVRLACRPELLVTLCGRHHLIADSSRGNAVTTRRGGEIQQSRRRRRTAVRRLEQHNSKQKKARHNRDKRKDWEQ